MSAAKLLAFLALLASLAVGFGITTQAARAQDAAFGAVAQDSPVAS